MKLKRVFRYLSSVILGGFIIVGYAQNNVTLIADPKILDVSVVDNKEPMIDLRNQKEILFGPSPEIPNNTDYFFMRKTVYDKLKQAQTLLPKGLLFCIYEGYRSLHLQKQLFDKKFAKVKSQHPNWPLEQIFRETTKLVSPVVNLDGSKNIPPHSTGGAIDVYLLNDKGETIDMGIHPKDWMLDNDGSFSFTASKKISQEAKNNRHIMSQALSSVGFINYPTEYWHWSYGDRYWAYHANHSHALYGSY